MPRLLIIALLSLLINVPLAAQEESGAGAVSPADDTDTAAEVSADEPGESDETGEAEEFDDSDLDEQVYEEDDDEFVPSEEIPADEAIPFPSNI